MLINVKCSYCFKLKTGVRDQVGESFPQHFITHDKSVSDNCYRLR